MLGIKVRTQALVLRAQGQKAQDSECKAAAPQSTHGSRFLRLCRAKSSQKPEP